MQGKALQSQSTGKAGAIPLSDSSNRRISPDLPKAGVFADPGPQDKKISTGKKKPKSRYGHFLNRGCARNLHFPNAKSRGKYSWFWGPPEPEGGRGHCSYPPPGGRSPCAKLHFNTLGRQCLSSPGLRTRNLTMFSVKQFRMNLLKCL